MRERIARVERDRALVFASRDRIIVIEIACDNSRERVRLGKVGSVGKSLGEHAFCKTRVCSRVAYEARHAVVGAQRIRGGQTQIALRTGRLTSNDLFKEIDGTRFSRHRALVRIKGSQIVDLFGSLIERLRLRGASAQKIERYDTKSETEQKYHAARH